MPAPELMIAFFAAASVFAFSPGPGMLYTAAQTIARGRAAGLMALFGLHLGGYVHVIAAGAGLSIIFHAAPILYMVVKIAGALFLIWLGLRLIFLTPAPLDDLPQIEPKSARRAFIESITVEVLNPKTALFFLAFLPQFIDSGAALPMWVQFIVLGTIVNVMFSLGDLLCVVMAGAVVEKLRRSNRAQTLTRRTGGAILVALGTSLAFQKT